MGINITYMRKDKGSKTDKLDFKELQKQKK